MTHHIRQWMEIEKGYRDTIILGNGASIAVSPRFGYDSLLKHAQRTRLLKNNVQRLFDFFGTSNFELVLRLLWQASHINRSLGIQDNRTYRAYQNVRDCLIQAVRAVHPAYNEVSDQLPNMYRFLKGFKTVLSLNYDLLVYWTMTYGLDVEDGHLFKDCFVTGMFDDNWQRFREPCREKTTTLVFYPHGSLALSRNVAEQEIKISRSTEKECLLERVLDVWCRELVVPLFVSEGTMQQKVSAIQNSYYLSTVYWEVLASSRPTLTLFGWGLGEQDQHLLRRMRGTGVQQVAVSVFCGDQDYCNHAYKVIQDNLGTAVTVQFFDSKSPGCWIH